MWRQKTLIHLKRVWALTYYLVRSKSLSLSVLLFELVLRCFNHLKITRRPSNYWKRVQSGASTSATVFSLNSTLTEMHQCSKCSGNKRFSLCRPFINYTFFVHASLHMVYLNMHFIPRQECVIYVGKVCCPYTNSAFKCTDMFSLYVYLMLYNLKSINLVRIKIRENNKWMKNEKDSIGLHEAITFSCIWQLSSFLNSRHSNGDVRESESSGQLICVLYTGS